jgi:hypothetical protein
MTLHFEACFMYHFLTNPVLPNSLFLLDSAGPQGVIEFGSIDSFGVDFISTNTVSAVLLVVIKFIHITLVQATKAKEEIWKFKYFTI